MRVVWRSKAIAHRTIVCPRINTRAFVSTRTPWTEAFKWGQRAFETSVYLLHALPKVDASMPNSWSVASFDFSANSTAFNLKEMSHDFFLFCAIVTSIVTSLQKACTHGYELPCLRPASIWGPAFMSFADERTPPHLNEAGVYLREAFIRGNAVLCFMQLTFCFA